MERYLNPYFKKNKKLKRIILASLALSGVFVSNQNKIK